MRAGCRRVSPEVAARRESRRPCRLLTLVVAPRRPAWLHFWLHGPVGPGLPRDGCAHAGCAVGHRSVEGAAAEQDRWQPRVGAATVGANPAPLVWSQVGDESLVQQAPPASLSGVMRGPDPGPDWARNCSLTEAGREPLFPDRHIPVLHRRGGRAGQVRECGDLHQQASLVGIYVPMPAGSECTRHPQHAEPRPTAA